MGVPKLIHRAWFGPREMPREYVEYGQRWEELNPDWHLIDWTYDMVPQLINEDLFHECGVIWRPNPGAAKTTTTTARTGTTTTARLLLLRLLLLRLVILLRLPLLLLLLLLLLLPLLLRLLRRR